MREAWQITDEKVQAAIGRVVDTAHPVSIVLFGSYVRGQLGPHSDVDILVVVGDEVVNCRHEGARIRKALRGISMPFEILVVRSKDLRALSATPGPIYVSVLKDGKIVYEKAA